MVRVKSTLSAMLSDGSVMAAVAQITITPCAVLGTWQLCIYHCIYGPQQPRKESSVNLIVQMKKARQREVKNIVQEHTVPEFLIKTCLLIPMLCDHPTCLSICVFRSITNMSKFLLYVQ